MSATTLSPIRQKAKNLLRRFLDHIERECDKLEGGIPNLDGGQWRTVSAVLATYRMLVDEHFQEEELKLAQLDYSKLSIDELHILVARFKSHPQLAPVSGRDQIDIPSNGGTP